MKCILLYLSLLSCCASYGQYTRPGKAAVTKLINITIGQKKQGCEGGSCGEWYANNKDSAFYKLDTVRMYNNNSFMYDTNHYCNFKIWELSKGNKFSQHGTELCREPPISTIEGTFMFTTISLNDHKTFKRIPIAAEHYRVIEKDSVAFLILYAGNKIFNSFKVIDISPYDTMTNGDGSFVITLVRQKIKRSVVLK